jgi:16S rRNA C967 or C1407 C5-methylase (RsmB/RsmF family)/NOL1/NOP2/fmu family ribosome biogenesis protein
MQLPHKLIASLQNLPGFNEEAFLQVHEKAMPVTSFRINPAKQFDVNENFATPFTNIPWSRFGYYLTTRPSFTLHPLLHAGCYYVQEASSMLLEQVMQQTTNAAKQLNVLDLCAAPGGKSTHLQSLISSQSLLVSNEVIKTRVNILEENITKWGAPNVIVTSNDPKDFVRLENFFDVIVIDAPCSGSGLFRRDNDAIAEWSENNVTLCQQRQQRIVANAWPALKKEGILIYATCSFSQQENEDILDKIVNDFDAESLPLQTQQHWNITATTSPQKGAFGYRCWPHKVKGEGFFIAAFKKNGGSNNHYQIHKKSAAETLVSKTTANEIIPYLLPGNYHFFKQHQVVHAIPAVLKEALDTLRATVYIKKAGVAIGEPAKKEFIPHHEYALSNLKNNALPVIELSLNNALRYLRKEEIMINENTKGWALAAYKGHSLGCMKILPNRINNYYPKEWRIKMK